MQPLARDRIRQLHAGASLVSFLPTAQALDQVRDMRDCGLTAYSLELVPRISRAQSMDALSSQALVAGYRSAIVAAGMLRHFFPLNMTAAGTVPPAEVLVLGAGRRRACRRSRRPSGSERWSRRYDVRAAAAEEIASMGAQAIDLDLDSLEGAGGYAREMTEERAERQRELLTPYIAAADALITTAAVPGRRAPMLVTRAMVEQMGSGSVVVDLAAESGGNVEGSVPGETVRIGEARVWGGRNVPSEMPLPASRLLSTNIVNLLTLMTGRGEDGAGFAPDHDDEVVAGLLRHLRGRGTARADPRAAEGGAMTEERMSEDVVWLTIFVLSVFVGIEVISKVSSTLHTPLMSGANAIHGVILVGAVLVTGTADTGLGLPSG